MCMRLGVLWFAVVFAVSGCGRPDVVPSDSSISLQIDTPVAVLQRGSSKDLLVQIERTGPEAAVQVSLRDPPLGVSADPLEVPVGQTSGTLHLRATEEVAVGDSVVSVLATSSGHGDSDNISLHVEDIPVGLPIVAAPEQTSVILEKGKTTEVAFSVDRSAGFSGSFVVEAPPAWLSSFEPVTVAYDATRFTLKLTVDALLPAKSYSLVFSLRGARRRDALVVNVQVVGPTEAPPQLTLITPDSFASQAPVHLTLKGTGLSGATEVSVVSDDGAYSGFAELVSASSNEIQANMTVYGGNEPFTVHPGQLTVRTPTGTVTWPVTLSRIYIDPVKGSDTTGTGCVSSPFATIQRAASVCPFCQRLGSAPGAFCPTCLLTLAPGVHHPGSITVTRNLILMGTGDLYGANPSILEGSGEEHFVVLGGTLRQVKLTGYKQGLEAQADYRIGEEQQKDYTLYADIADVWLTGGDYGLSTCEALDFRAEKAPLRISDNRIAGIRCHRSLGLKGTAVWPVEILRNGDGSAESGGVVNVGLYAEYTVVRDNQGAGVKVASGRVRNSIIRGNTGPGVWALGGTDLGTAASPGGNTLQDNAINLRVDGSSSVAVSAVGNCWNPPAGSEYADTSADGDCGRILKPFSLGATPYIDATGLTQGPFTWTAPPRFNSLLTPTGSSTPTIQF